MATTPTERPPVAPPPPRRPPGFVTALRGSGAAAPFVASLIGRLPMGAVGLVFILRTNEITGSFALGGLATGAYALSIGLIAPAMGRLIDLKGQTRVLIGTAVVYASALIGFSALPNDAGVLPIVALGTAQRLMIKARDANRAHHRSRCQPSLQPPSARARQHPRGMQ